MLRRPIGLVVAPCRSLFLDFRSWRRYRSLRHAEDELRDSLKPQAGATTHNADDTPPVTGQASYTTPTVSSQHTNATASHSDATATMNNESLRLFLPQYSLQTCYFKRHPMAPKYLSHRSQLLFPAHRLPWHNSCFLLQEQQ